MEGHRKHLEVHTHCTRANSVVWSLVVLEVLTGIHHTQVIPAGQSPAWAVSARIGYRLGYPLVAQELTEYYPESRTDTTPGKMVVSTTVHRMERCSQMQIYLHLV